jgi:adenosine deaminase
MTDRAMPLPKVEIHLHLEGSIPLDALWEVMQKYGGDPGVRSRTELEARFRYRDFPHFIETWLWKNGFLREYEDFTFIASKVAEDLSRQEIRYVEAFYSPPDFARHGLEVQAITEAIRKGLDAYAGSIETWLIADIVRDSGPQAGMRTVDQVAEVKDLGVIGIGMGGSEQAYPPEPFAAVYERARSHGFRTTVHAGEAAGADSVWGALRELRVDRIGHGTRAVEDPSLVALLAELQVPVELCPISNLKTGVVDSLAAHPIRRFMEAGVLVSVNTDDPKMFGTSLAAEYAALAEELAFQPDEIRRLMESAIRSTWADPATRRRLLEEDEAAIPQA